MRPPHHPAPAREPFVRDPVRLRAGGGSLIGVDEAGITFSGAASRLRAKMMHLTKGPCAASLPTRSRNGVGKPTPARLSLPARGRDGGDCTIVPCPPGHSLPLEGPARGGRGRLRLARARCTTPSPTLPALTRGRVKGALLPAPADDGWPGASGQTSPAATMATSASRVAGGSRPRGSQTCMSRKCPVRANAAAMSAGPAGSPPSRRNAGSSSSRPR